jgi:hypothetical protein
MKRLLVAVLASGLVLAAAGASTAKPIEHVHLEESTSEIVRGFCGLARVRVDAHIRSHLLFNAHGRERLGYFHGNFRGTFSYTNLATGKTMTEILRVTDKDLKVTNNRDGTLTILALATGVHKVLGPDGKVFLIDSGQVRFAFVVDHGGTPSDPSDDEIVADLGIVKESTGRNDLEGRDFCEDVRLLTG